MLVEYSACARRRKAAGAGAGEFGPQAAVELQAGLGSLHLTKPSPMPSQATTLGGGSALGRLRAEAGDGTVPQITAEQATPTHDPRPLLVDRLTADAPDLPCRGEDIRE